MLRKLIELSGQLDKIGLYDEAYKIEAIIKQAIKTRSEQTLRLLQDPKFQSNLTKLMASFGLITTPEAITELLNAAGYLKEGITQNNLLIAGLSIVSLINGLSTVKLVIPPKLKDDPELNAKIAHLIFQNQSAIQAKISQFNNPDKMRVIKAYVPDGELLVKYADQMWNAVREWMLSTIEIERTQSEEIEEPINDLLPDQAP